MMTRDEILAVYECGPEAVVTLVQTLLISLQSHEHRISQLENRLAKNSHNSHKPPSSDGLAKKKPKKKGSRPKTNKAPGGQPGHPGTTLRLSDQPEAVIRHLPTDCSGCGASLDGVEEQEVGFQRRQVHDVPPLVALHVTEHRVFGKVCPSCQSTTNGSFPKQVTRSVQYGERLKALCVYLQEYQLLPFWRTRELLLDLFGAAPSEGTLDNALAECHAGLFGVEEEIKRALIESDVLNLDETGMRIGSKTHWLHQVGTQELTFYAHHRKRGREAMDFMGILAEFGGTSVHDCFSSYFTYKSCAHALCNAHLLRELIAVEEQDAKKQQQQWASGMIALLREMKVTVDQARESGKQRLDEDKREELEARYARLVVEGLKANPPPPPDKKNRGRVKQSAAKNLLDRFDKHRESVILFMHDFRVPFDNNLLRHEVAR